MALFRLVYVNSLKLNGVGPVDNRRGRIGLRMFIQTIAGTTIHTIKDTSNEEDPHVYNLINRPGVAGAVL